MQTITSIQELKDSIRNVPDFPKKGILFKDITTLIKNREYFQDVIALISDYYICKNITKVLGIESRGFILGGAIASKLNAGFIPVRKPGKLPADKYSHSYELEYGSDTVEIHKDALTDTDVVLLHDDLLATGGTIKAVVKMLKNFNPQKIYINFLIELDFLEGRRKIGEDYEIYSLLHF